MLNFEKSIHTVEDMMALPGENRRVELINGEIHMMAPVAAIHAEVDVNLIAVIKSYFDHKKKKGPKDFDFWRILAEAWTYYDERNSFVHDIAGFSRRDLPKLPDAGPIHVRPVWVCEILSPSNWSNDTERKRVILEQYNIPYYWLVDPTRKSITVNQVIYSVSKGDKIVKLPPFDDLKLDLMEVFDV